MFFILNFYFEAGEDFNAKEWKKLTAKELGIKPSMIAKPTRVVLQGLKEKGIERFARLSFIFYGKERIKDVVVIYNDQAVRFTCTHF